MLKQYIKNRRLLAVLFLGFSSGLPLALTGATLQAWFTQEGISVVAIGALSLIGVPYVWKFLWAPLVDRFVPPFLGRRRGWIALMQLSLCVTLLVMARMSPHTAPGWLGLVAVMVAFASATQDVAVDAYRTDVLLPEERGPGAAIYIFAYRIAMLISGGLALVLAEYWGWQLTYQLMAVLMALLVLNTYFSPEISNAIQPPRTFYAAVVEPFADLLQRKAITLILLFVIFYKLGDALALSLMSNFLLRGLEFSLVDVGLAYKTVGLLATILGAFAGGIYLTRLGLYRSLLVFGLAQAFSNLMFVFLALAGKNYLLMVSAIFIESFCSGMSTAALVAFLMALCHQRYSATQFACLSALASIGRVFLGPVAGVMVAHWGWVNFYSWAFVLSFPGILFLTLMRNRIRLNAQWAV